MLDKDKADLIDRACEEIKDGKLHDQFVVDIMQGGAGTSTNMNTNEVIANRGLERQQQIPEQERQGPLHGLRFSFGAAGVFGPGSGSELPDVVEGTAPDSGTRIITSLMCERSCSGRIVTMWRPCEPGSTRSTRPISSI